MASAPGDRPPSVISSFIRKNWKWLLLVVAAAVVVMMVASD
jgi:hypothetical protein